MATSNNRDVKMTLSVETLGDDGIQQLRSSLLALAKGGGDAAPEFKRLADEIDRLGEQAGALKTFEALNAEVQALGAQQAEAASKVQTLKTELASVAAVTDASRQAQAAATAELKRSQDALAATNGELKILRNSYDDSGKRVANYKADLQRLVEQQVEQSAAIRANREAQKAANAELKDAEVAQAKVEASLTKQEKALKSVNTALDTQQSTLKAQAAAVEGYGLSTEDLALSQAKLLQAINGTGAAAQGLDDNLRAAAAAERELDAQNEIANQRLQERMKWLQQSADEETALARQRVAAAEAQANAERALVAERKAADDKAAAEARASFNARIADLNTEIKYRRQLAADRAKLAEETAAAEKAAADKSAAAQKAAAEKAAADQKAAANGAAAAIEGAFETAGAKSAAALRQQIEAVRGAMASFGTQAGLTGRELAVAMSAGNAKIKELERDLREATGQLTLADRATKLFSNSLGQIAAGNLIADGIGFLVEKVKALGREFFTANIQAESMTRALNAVYKSSEVAASQMAFLNTAANAAGVSVSKIADDFVKFSAATQSSNIPLADSNALFAALTQAAGTLGLGSDKVALSLNALGQIASKSVVSMEELRGQLGDALPGSLSLAAKGMGITDAALIKLVESGNLASSTFIPAFTEGLRTLAGENDTLQGSLARLSNATNAFFRALGDAGILQVMKAGLAGVTETAKGAYAVFTVLTEGFFSVGRAVGAMAGAFATGQSVFQAATDVFAAMDARLTLFMTTLYGNADAAAEARARLDGLNASGAQAAEVSVQAERALVKFNIALADQKKKLEDRTTAAERDVKVSEIVGNNMTTLAQLSGSVTTAINAEIDAANRNVTAKNAVVSALESELRFHQESLAATELLISQKAKQTEADIKLVDGLKKLVAERTQDVEKAKEQAQASQLIVTASTLEAQKHQDNSARVGELRTAYTEAETALQLVIAAEKLGYDVSEQKRKATETLRVAQALYNDSLGDTSAKIQANNTLAKADYDIKVASLNLLKANYVAMEANAKAMGNEYQIRQAKIGQMQVDIDLTKAKIAFMQAEAEGSIAVANAKLTELKASGELTPVKQAEIEASIKVAEAKMLEAKAVGASVKELERQLTAFKNGTTGANTYKTATDGVTGSMGGMSAATNAASDAVERMNMKYMQSSQYSERQIALLEKEVSAREKLNEVREREIALENKRRNIDKEGFTLNTAGERVVAGVQTEASLTSALKAQGVDDETAARKAKELKVKYELWAKGTATDSTMGGFSQGEIMKNSWLARPFEEIIAQTANDVKARAAATPAAPTTAATPTATTRTTTATQPTTTPTAAKTYNVQIGGKTIKTASDSDAQALIGILKSASLTS